MILIDGHVIRQRRSIRWLARPADGNNDLHMGHSNQPRSETTEELAEADRETKPIKRFFLVLGPGLITGASDDDPSGIGTYATAGAAFGFATLWTAVLTLPMMAAIQFICAKIGLVSGRGLAGVLR